MKHSRTQPLVLILSRLVFICLFGSSPAFGQRVCEDVRNASWYGPGYEGSIANTKVDGLSLQDSYVLYIYDQDAMLLRGIVRHIDQGRIGVIISDFQKTRSQLAADRKRSRSEIENRLAWIAKEECFVDFAMANPSAAAAEIAYFDSQAARLREAAAARQTDFGAVGGQGASGKPLKSRDDQTGKDVSPDTSNKSVASDSKADGGSATDHEVLKFLRLSGESGSSFRSRRDAYMREHRDTPMKNRKDMMAHGCIVSSPVGLHAPYNNCGFDVEVTFCVDKPSFSAFGRHALELAAAFDCQQSKEGMTTISAGKHLGGSWRGEKFVFFGCRKPAYPHANFDHASGTMKGYCD